VKASIRFRFLLAAILLLQLQLWARSRATLLATTDLDCTWKLDGAPRGILKADGATVVPVSRGKHLVQATSLDGRRSFRSVITITRPEQEMVEIKLKEAQPATQPPPIAQQPVITQPPAAQPQPSPQPLAEAPRPEHPTWTDPATGLMWAGRDNGRNLTWREAGEYCNNLKLEGYSNWRLPTISELSDLYDPAHAVNGWHIKGGIAVSGLEWSSEARNASGEEARFFSFRDAKHSGLRIASDRRALCVRRAGK
jgi:Protein of unknown function (DUF1566)